MFVGDKNHNRLYENPNFRCFSKAENRFLIWQEKFRILSSLLALRFWQAWNDDRLNKRGYKDEEI